MTTAPWFPIDASAWAALSARLTGEWTEGEAVTDLRYWANREKETGKPSPMPSRGALAKRWTWTDWAVRALLRDEARWRSPVGHFLQPPSSLPPDSLQPPSSPPPESLQPPLQETPIIDEIPPAALQPASRVPPESLQPPSSPPPQARGKESITKNNKNTSTYDPDVLAAWARAFEHHPVLGSKPTKAAAQAIAARIAEHGLADVVGVIDWVFKGPAPWWRDTNPAPASFLRPTHYDSLAPKARAWALALEALPGAPPGSPGGRPAPLRAWDDGALWDEAMRRTAAEVEATHMPLAAEMALLNTTYAEVLADLQAGRLPPHPPPPKPPPRMLDQEEA